MYGTFPIHRNAGPYGGARRWIALACCVASNDDVGAALAALGTYTEEAAAKGVTVRVAGLKSDNLSGSKAAAASQLQMRPARFELATF
jgi:hypothetical protein